MINNEEQIMLTTIDNPHNPKTEYDKWKRWDEDNDYNTESYIARLLDMEDEFDVEDDVKLNTLTNKVILDILEHDMLKVYTLVY